MKNGHQAHKVLLFYNPIAGNGMFKNNLDLIIEKFQKHGMIIVPVRADRPDTLNEIIARFGDQKPVLEASYRKIIAAGGDGTINAVATAIVKNDLSLPLAIFPSGTANDFASYFDLPHKIEDMIDVALHENYTAADIGKAGGKYFANVLAMGMLVDVSQKIDPGVKNTLGLLAYYIQGFTELPNLRPIPIKITHDGGTIETDMFFMVAMNGRAAGGFKRIAPQAEINDGLLDVMVFKEMPIFDLAPLFFSVMAGAAIHGNKNIISFKTSKMHIESEREIISDVDGERGDPLPFDIEIIPRRLRINTLNRDMEGAVW